jgi:excisionase family DNA binding protein
MQDIETYSPKELAQALKIPYRIVLHALKTGSLKAIHFGKRHRRIHSKSAAAWIQSITR